MAALQRLRRGILGVGAALAACAGGLEAQSAATVRVPENFRRLPNDEVLARLEPGTSVTVLGGDEEWREVEVEGWVWTRSLQVVDRGGLDLVVAAGGGENLRAEPSGPVRGRLEEGTLLEELERRPGWIRARRRGWIWAASLTEPTAETEASPGSADAANGTSAGDAPASRPEPVELMRAGEDGAAILGSPGGDTLATAAAGGELEVTGREGSWARVRLEGWVWLPAAASADPGEAPEMPTPADLRADSAPHRGRVVTWPLEFISLEEAERVRTDFFEGEPFLLTRYGGSDGPFVYVAVPPRYLERAEGLTPLEALMVTGRIRTGASALTGTPILDLLELVRGGPR
jgi:hypothetical protein